LLLIINQLQSLCYQPHGLTFGCIWSHVATVGNAE